MKSREEIYSILNTVTDPEVPVLTILDLGIVREVDLVNDTDVRIFITPTYSGCPAMNAISTAIRMALLEHGFKNIEIKEQLSPAWTTDWMSEEGKRKLNEYGIAPPQYTSTANATGSNAIVPCPRCASTHTELLSEFGSTSCKSLYRCKDCLEPFDYFKCH